MEWTFSTLSYYGEALLRLFFPSLCAGCNRLLEIAEKGLCLTCQSGLQKHRFLPSEERVRVALTTVDEGWALFRYEGMVKEVLHKVKFERRRDLLHLFDPELAYFLKRRPRLASYDRLIAIPLDPFRRMEREFNQSGVLAEKIQKIMGTPIEPGGLVKKRSTWSQSLLGRPARRLNMEKVFRVPDERKIRNRSILLVDDIFTTGATIEEAARTLKASGAARIGFLALSRTLLS